MVFDHGVRTFVAMVKAIATKPSRVRPSSCLTYASGYPLFLFAPTPATSPAIPLVSALIIRFFSSEPAVLKRSKGSAMDLFAFFEDNIVLVKLKVISERLNIASELKLASLANKEYDVFC